MRQHFDDHFLTAIPVGELIAMITSVAADLRGEIVVISQAPLGTQVRIASLEIFASAAAEPPQRLTGLQAVPRVGHITDTRVAFSSEHATGQIRTTFAAVPRRRAVLAAKAAVVGAVALVLGELLAFVSFFLVQAILSGHHLGIKKCGPPGALEAESGFARDAAGCGVGHRVHGIGVAPCQPVQIGTSVGRLPLAARYLSRKGCILLDRGR